MRPLVPLFACVLVWSSCDQRAPERCERCSANAEVCPADNATDPSRYEVLETCPEPSGIGFLPPNPPNVMLLVDKSVSMYDHWAQLLQLTPYIQGMSELTRPGLALFPTDDDCSVDDVIRVPVASGTADEILQEIEQSGPSGFTPLACALDAVRLDGGCRTPTARTSWWWSETAKRPVAETPSRPCGPGTTSTSR